MKLILPYLHILESKGHYRYLIKKVSDAGWTSTRYFPDYSSAGLDRYVGHEERIKFIKKLITDGHHSCLEHGTISVLIVADRGFMAELTRHRTGISFTIESTRYCNYSGSRFGEIQYIDPRCYCEDLGEDEYNAILEVLKNIEQTYKFLTEEKKVKPEIARAILPNTLAVHIYATANIREWRHIISLRKTKHNHPLMQGVISMLLEKLKMRYPVFFKDLECNE